MAYGDPNDFGWCNLVVKFLLFVTNIIVWLLGLALLGAGIFILASPETNLEDLDVGSLLTAPAIILCIIGGALFLLGFCGCFGALLELYYPLILYTVALSVLVVLELAVVIYVYLQQEQAYSAVEDTLQEAIVGYYDDPDKASIIDSAQSELLQCCGVNGPDDWQLNEYFNCTGRAVQACAVPYSCCDLEDGEILNVQCGYQVLNETSPTYFMLADTPIYTIGCVDRMRSLVRNNLDFVLGVCVGLLIFELFNIMLAGGLALDIRKEKAALKALKK